MCVFIYLWGWVGVGAAVYVEMGLGLVCAGGGGGERIRTRKLYFTRIVLERQRDREFCLSGLLSPWTVWEA